MHAIFQAQHAAFHCNCFPPIEERMNKLLRLRRMLTNHAAFFQEAIHNDFGYRNPQETLLSEVGPSIAEIDFLMRHLKRIAAPQRVTTPWNLKPASSFVQPIPRGVVGIVVPWNFPLVLSFTPIADALAAGNAVMVKLSESTPRFAEALQSVVGKYFSRDELAFVSGDAQVAQAFVRLPFDLLLYTGGGAVAKDVLKASADHLTPTVLELGGKCPAVLTPHCRMEEAVRRILVAKILNAGQICIAPDTVWVQEKELDRFILAAKRRMQRLLPDQSQMTWIVNARHHERLLGLLEDAIQQGARVVDLLEPNPDTPKRRMLPMLVIDPGEMARIHREEIFGPLLLVRTYDHIESVIARLTTTSTNPLALYWFDSDRKRMRRIVEIIPAGGVTMNDTLLHFVNNALPFGGIGSSGMGVYHGEAGFRTMSHLKPVFQQSRINFFGWMDPPYSALARRIIRFLSR